MRMKMPSPWLVFSAAGFFLAAYASAQLYKEARLIGKDRIAPPSEVNLLWSPPPHEMDFSLPRREEPTLFVMTGTQSTDYYAIATNSSGAGFSDYRLWTIRLHTGKDYYRIDRETGAVWTCSSFDCTDAILLVSAYYRDAMKDVERFKPER